MAAVMAFDDDDNDLPGHHSAYDAHIGVVPGQPFVGNHLGSDHHFPPVVNDDLPRDHFDSDDHVAVVSGQPLGGDQRTTASHRRFVPAETSVPDQTITALQFGCVGDNLSATDHVNPDTHVDGVGSVPSQPAETMHRPTSILEASRLADVLLLIYADALDDFERTRIATENRARALRDAKEMADTPEETRLLAMCEALRGLEHQAELELKRCLRTHPFGPWVKATVGIGEKQGARLLAAIGDPYWNNAQDRPRRGPAELWAYCGYHVLHPGHVAPGSHIGPAGVEPSDTSGHPHDGPHTTGAAGVAPRRSRGQKANWNDSAKMRAYLCAEAAVKAGIRKMPGLDDGDGYDFAHRQAVSPLGAVYLDGRVKYADAVHGSPCARCGPAGKPATVGSPLSPGHQHARALRLVAKNILKELWIEGRRLHGS